MGWAEDGSADDKIMPSDAAARMRSERAIRSRKHSIGNPPELGRSVGSPTQEQEENTDARSFKDTTNLRTALTARLAAGRRPRSPVPKRCIVIRHDEPILEKSAFLRRKTSR